MYSWALRKCIAYTNNFRGHKESTSLNKYEKVAWPSGLRRWFKAPVSSGAWVRIPPLPNHDFTFFPSVRMAPISFWMNHEQVCGGQMV